MARDGRFIKLIGTIERASEPLQSPLLGLPCVHDAAALVEWRRVSIHESNSVSFLLRDRSGVALIDPEAAVLRAPARDVPPGDRCAEFLRRHGRALQGVAFFTDQMRFRESALVVGAPVAVFGLARRVPEASVDGTHREAATRIVIQRPLWISSEHWALRL